jgi:hypothetical protein
VHRRNLDVFKTQNEFRKNDEKSTKFLEKSSTLRPPHQKHRRDELGATTTFELRNDFFRKLRKISEKSAAHVQADPKIVEKTSKIGRKSIELLKSPRICAYQLEGPSKTGFKTCQKDLVPGTPPACIGRQIDPKSPKISKKRQKWSPPLARASSRCTSKTRS